MNKWAVFRYVQAGNIGLYLNTAYCSSIVPGYRPFHTNALKIYFKPQVVKYNTHFHYNISIYFFCLHFKLLVNKKVQLLKFTHFSTFSLFTALSPSLLLTSLPNSSSAFSRTSRHSLLVVLVVAKDVCITPTWSNAFDISTFVLYARSLILL